EGGGGRHGLRASAADSCHGGRSEGAGGGGTAAALRASAAATAAATAKEEPRAKAGSEWALSKHAGRADSAARGWGCYRPGLRESGAGAGQATGMGPRAGRGVREHAPGVSRSSGTGNGRSGRGWGEATPSPPLAAASAQNPTSTPARHVSVMVSVRPQD
ncbi:unnamed protein product, partial [Scytosiphon promiscuus]